MPDNEPTVKGSWPPVRLVAGIPHWHIEGTREMIVPAWMRAG